MNTENDYFVHESSYVDKGATIGKGTKIWHFCHVQTGAVIGEKCSFGQNVNIGENVIVGNECRVQNNVSLYEGVELEDGVFCGPSCVFTNDFLPRIRRPRDEESWERLKTIVKHDASIGANATIVCGNTIGEFSLIGAGSVVTHDVPAYALVAGVPARQIGWVCTCGKKLDASLVCSSCGKRYSVQNNVLSEIN